MTTRLENKSTLRSRKSTLRDAHSRSRKHCATCLECNCTKIMHARYFRIFWVSWIKIGCSMRVVYAECVNNW